MEDPPKIASNEQKETQDRKTVDEKMQSSFDPAGSWTGNYLLGYYEDPVQDVDDL